MKRKLINTIRIDKANLEHIAKTGEINGTLLIEIERVMSEYAQNQANEATPNELQENDRSQLVSFSLRDKFAMMALNGLTSATDQDGTWAGNDPDTVSEEAYRIADAMIKARKQ